MKITLTLLMGVFVLLACFLILIQVSITLLHLHRLIVDIRQEIKEYRKERIDKRKSDSILAGLKVEKR